MTDQSTSGQDIAPLESVWMDMLRGLAILAVVIHHWLLFIPYESSPITLFSFAELIQNGAGTTVHLFFILSGCGLTLSYFKKGAFSWGQWVRRRFGKIVVPLWVIITLTFVLVNLLNAIHSEVFESRYSWLGLFTYLTFTRNFYSPAWGLNPTLWFMPVIFGLYVLFPILIPVLNPRLCRGE
jgi:peptidoglycan/LPS O-acetylase OafA/YrhL